MKRKIMIEELIDCNDEISYDTVRLLALASASMIIQECENWKVDVNGVHYPTDETALGKLNSNFIWPIHDFILALESHVEIVYGFVEYSLYNFNGNCYSDYYWIEEEGAAFLTDALEIYQEWKDDIIENGKVLGGEMWGIPAGSDKAMWNEHNKELLNLCKMK